VCAIAATFTPVAVQISPVTPAVASVAAQVTRIAVLGSAIVAQVATIPPRLAITPVGAIVPELATIGTPVTIVGPKVAPVATHVPAVAPKIAAVGANVAGIAAKLAGTRRGHRLRTRYRRRTGRQRERHAKCHQCVAKHCHPPEIVGRAARQRRSRR
jgi:hypothetical protein